MTEQELDEMEAMAKGDAGKFPEDRDTCPGDVLALVAEVRRLNRQAETFAASASHWLELATAEREERAKYREIVQAVADARLVSTDYGWCLCSDSDFDAAGKWRESARALLEG